MFSLEDFKKLEKKKSWIQFFVFIVSFFTSVFSLALLNLIQYKILVFVFFILMYLFFNYLITKRINRKFEEKYSDIVSYIFFREYYNEKKYDIKKNFTSSEIVNFIENLNCKSYAEANNIPTEFYFVQNNDYLILKFDENYFQHYTRKILWKDLFWKYTFIMNDGVYEFVTTNYVNNNKVIEEEILTDKISAKPFHIFLLFILYDLKYGKKLSLSRGYYRKKKYFKFLGITIWDRFP